MAGLFGKDLDEDAMGKAIARLTEVFDEARTRLIENTASRSIEDDVVAQVDEDGMWWKPPPEDKMAPDLPADFEIPEHFR